MFRLINFFGFVLLTTLVFSGCGEIGVGENTNAGTSTNTSSNNNATSSVSSHSNSDSQITSMAVSTGSGEVPNDPCSQGGPKCKKNYSDRVYSRDELPRPLWCRYGYSGADEYCRVKINEKAFHKNR